MLHFSFNIDIFDFCVHYAQVDTVEDIDEFEKVYKRIFRESISEEIKEDLDSRLTGGYHIFSRHLKTSFILVYNPGDFCTMINALTHEKRHVEDTILEFLGIEDFETAGYLAGFLTQKLFPKILVYNNGKL